MAENLMNKDHKATNDAYREGYDRIFTDRARIQFEKCGDNLWKVKTEDPIRYTVTSASVSVSEEPALCLFGDETIGRTKRKNS